MSSLPPLRDGEQKIFFKAGGQWCYLWTPETFRREEENPLLIHHHGARGYVKEGAADWLMETQKVAYLKAIMDGCGCSVTGSHACGDHWGNSEAVKANAALLGVLEKSCFFDPSRIGLMGGGLGGALVWNSVLGPFAGKVKAVAVMQSVASLEAVIREKKFRSPCLKAYGISDETRDDEAVLEVSPFDPLKRLRKLNQGTALPRTAIYHGAEDENIPPQTNAVPLRDALQRLGCDVTLELFPGVGHSVYSMGKPIEELLSRFFSSSL